MNLFSAVKNKEEIKHASQRGIVRVFLPALHLLNLFFPLYLKYDFLRKNLIVDNSSTFKMLEQGK